MQSTGDFHHEIANNAAPEADRILDHATAFDTAVHMFNPHPAGGQRLIVRFLFRRELAPAGFLDRLPHGDPIQLKREEPEILKQGAAVGQGIGAVIGNPLVVDSAFKGGAQEEDVQGRVNQDRVFDGVVFGLAAIMERLFSRVRGARDGALGGIMTKRGSAGSSGVLGASSDVWGAVSTVSKRAANAA